MKVRNKLLAGMLSAAMLLQCASPAAVWAAETDGNSTAQTAVLAAFDFDALNAAGNGFDGGDAYASVHGTNLSLEDHADNGKAVKLGNNTYLDLRAADGGSLLTGWDDVTISFDLKPTSTQSWVLYAAPNDQSLNWDKNGNKEQYLGFLVKNGTMEVERYHNSGSRPQKPTASFTVGAWNHVEVALTETKTVVSVNGAQVSEKDSSYLLSGILEGGSILQIGKANWGNGEYSDMALDNLRITAAVGASVTTDAVMNLTEGKSKTMRVKGISQYANPEITYTSDHAEIAAVDETGNITGMSAGTAAITANVRMGEAVKRLQTQVNVAEKRAPQTVVSLDFDDASIGDATALAEGNYADYTGEIVYGEGRVGKALQLDGYGLRLNKKNVGENYTVSLWMKHDKALKENQQILALGRGDAAGENWLDIAGDRGSSHTYEIWTRNIMSGSEISGWKYLDEDTPQEIGTWTMLTVTGDGAQFHAYLNGKELELNGGGSSEEALRNAANVLNGAEQDIYIGVNYWDSAFQGLIDDVTVYDQDMTAAEVQELYARQYLEYAAEKLDLGDLTAVSENLTLPKRAGEAQIVWTSSNPAVLAEDGTIARQDTDTQVTLKGAFTFGGCTLEKEYQVTVRHADLTEDLEEAYDALGLCKVTDQDLTLPSTGKKNTKLTWTSSDPSVLTAEGKIVSRPAAGSGNAKVTLTAQISKGEQSLTKTFEIEVLEAYAGYIYGYITGNNDRTGSLHLAYSEDGKTYTALNANAGVHFAHINPEDGTKNLTTGIRFTEISLFRKADGTFGMAAPQAKDQKQIYVYDSEDLLTYTGERLLLSNSSIGNVSDVAVRYDAAADGYDVFWTSGGAQYANATADLQKLEAAVPKAYTVQENQPESAPESARHGSVIGVTKAEYEKILDWFAKTAYKETEPVETVIVRTAADVKDALPDTVRVTYEDGSAAAMDVAWDVDTPDFSKAGTYEVTGTLRTYANPLIEERADPQILYDEARGCYYFTASYPAYGDVNSGYDRIVLRKADTIGGLAADETEITIWTAPKSGTMAKHVWAPELHQIAGKWYVFFAAGNSDNIWAIKPYVLVCQGDDPYDAANWVKADKTAEIHAAQSEDAGCFDAMSLDMTYFTDEDAEGVLHHYVIWAELSPSSLYMQEIDPQQPWRGKGNVICLTAPEYGWERDSERVNEGPAILKHDGKIFCAFSASGTGPEYCIGLLYADEASDLMDPASWKKLGYPVLTSEDVPGEYGPGHNSFTVDADGNPVFVYHARSEACYKDECAYANKDPLYDPCRHARVKNVHWNSAGFPILNAGAAEELPEQAKTVKMQVTIEQDTIVKRDLAEAVITGVSDAVETGNQICPQITVNWGTAVLMEGADYIVSYGENKSGKGTVTITAAADSRYTGSKTAEFQILPYVIADFDFDSLTDGLRGGNAAASVAGGSIELTAHGDGNAAKFTASEKDWLNVTAADGGSLLDGYEEFTISYDILPDTSGTHWVFYAAQDDAMLNWNDNGNHERYLGVLVKNGTTEIERYNNNGSRPAKPTMPMTADKWQHVDIVYTKDCTVAYLDGARVSKADTAYQLTDILGTGSLFQIGKANWSPGEYANMQLDNFRIVADTALYEEDQVNQAFAEIEAKLGDIRNVTGNLELLKESSDGLRITWSSSNPDVVAADGTVTIPAGEDVTVTLKAVIAGGKELAEKTYTVTVLAQENLVNKLAAELTLPYGTEEGKEVYGNITLPETVNGKGSVAWTTDHPEIVDVHEKENSGGYDAAPAGVVTRPKNDTSVTMTATITLDGKQAEKTFTFTVKAAPKTLTEDDYTDYFFAYFTGEGYADGEQIYFSASHDGLNWKELNNNQPVLTSTLGEKGLRDPFIIRSPEGDKFYLIATDLKINGGNGWTAAQEAGSQSLMVWESADLIHWSDQRMVPVSAGIDAGCTWAPEAIYDARTGEYVVFWASKVAGDHYAKQRLYYAKTRDFYSFTEPKVYIEKDQSSIDTTMIEHNGTYYRYTKNEGGATNELGAQTKTIFIEKSSDVLGSFTHIPSDTLNDRSNQYVEGPTIFKFNKDDADTDTWCLLVDDFGGGGYYPLLTNDLESGAFTRLASGYQLPGGSRFPRHGTPIRVTAKEFAAVAKAYQMETMGVEELKTEIDALEVTNTNRAQIKELAETYQGLTEEEKALVTEAQYEKLQEALALAELLKKDGVTVKDQSKNGYDLAFGTQTHAIYTDAAENGRYMKGYASVTNEGAKETFDSLINGMHPFTVEMVINPNGYGKGGDDYNLLFSKGDDCAALRVSEQSLYFHIKDESGWHSAQVALTEEQMSSWIHVAAIYDGSRIIAYADGKTSGVSVGAILPSDYTFGVGYCEQKSRYGRSGIRSLHVYDKALTAARLDENNLTAAEDGVVLWYDFGAYSYGVQPSEIRMDAKSMTLNVGETGKPVIDIHPYYAENAVVWSTQDDKVAQAAADGTITAVGEGSTVIRAAAAGASEVHAEIAVTVTDTEKEAALAQAKAALTKLLAEVQPVAEAGQKEYTDASWNALKAAYDAAVKASAEAAETLSIAEWNALAETLSKALQALEVKETPKPEPQPQPTPQPEETLKTGDEVVYKNVRYRVLNAEKKTAAAIEGAAGMKKKMKKAVIPATVKVKGVTCTVTEIGAKAFRNFKKLKKVTIGKNVTTIRKQAFFGCKKLKTVVVKGKKLKTIQKKAFRKTGAKVTVRTPRSLKKKKRAALLKKMKRRGMSKRSVVK